MNTQTLEPQPPGALQADIAIVGAGAAGMMAAIAAGRAARHSGACLRIVLLDSARRPGAKILVAGGGRCNVTHHEVTEQDYNVGPGSSRNSVRNILRGFDVPRTVAFFAELGVQLKREETGKLFPTTDDAHTVLDALLRAVREAGCELLCPWRVEAITRDAAGFVLSGPAGVVAADRIIIATGGKSLPKTGSDGHGWEMLRLLGHTVTRTFPALVPLVVDKSAKCLTDLSGLSHIAEVQVCSPSGRKVAAYTGSLLCTHFGLSGPAALDVSRHLAAARFEDRGATLHINWLPGRTTEQCDAALVAASARPGSVLRALLDAPAFAPAMPDRLARAVIESAGVDPAAAVGTLTRDVRRALARALTAMPVPVTGDRGYLFAEVTAGGVPLSEIRPATMESRPCPGLHICGEACDVDGRIGGFNFQWAWSSGWAAGQGAAQSLAERERNPRNLAG
ncbi:MAG: aminoacetone oxidase family FAD-binding enzyme [Phycisphaeraceae bacterium]|nr:aminoacetone oxidase family FAD-binding enzyme [Phycisphaeraceae bacterium]